MMIIEISCSRQLKQVEYVQNALNHYEAVVHVLPHLAMKSDSLVRESLAFIVTMLFGGNRVVQVSRLLLGFSNQNCVETCGILPLFAPFSDQRPFHLLLPFTLSLY